MRISLDGVVITTDCIRLTNSKNLKILCTRTKTVCKTEQEIHKALDKVYGGYGELLTRYDNGYLYNFSVQYPADILAERWLDAEGKGAWFADKEDGEVMVKVFGEDTSTKNIKEAYTSKVKDLLEDKYIEITFKKKKKDWFVFSGYNHKLKTIFYSKYYFTATNNKNKIMGFDITYSIKKKKKYAKLVEIINKSFKVNGLDTIKKHRVNRIKDMIIGEGREQCQVFMNSSGAIINTTCLQLTNSKKVKILCTQNKNMCKTLNEVKVSLFAPKHITYRPSYNCHKAHTHRQIKIT